MSASDELTEVYRMLNGFGAPQPGETLTLAKHQMSRLKRTLKLFYVFERLCDIHQLWLTEPPTTTTGEEHAKS